MAEANQKVDYPKAISLIATLLLCAGIISQTVYYFFFNIPITEFLSLSEILLLFTQDVIRYIIIFSALFIFTIVTTYSKPPLRHKRFFVEYTQTRLLKDRILKYLEVRFSTIIYYALGIVFLFVLLKEGNKIVFLFALYFSVEVIYFFVRFLLFENRRVLRLKKQLKTKDRNLGLVFTFSLHFVFFIIVWSLIDVQRVKYEQKYINVSFRLNSDSLYKSDSNKYYIGQTDKYLFYFDSKKNNTTVFKKENINEVYFGRINYFNIKRKK